MFLFEKCQRSLSLLALSSSEHCAWRMDGRDKMDAFDVTNKQKKIGRNKKKSVWREQKCIHSSLECTLKLFGFDKPDETVSGHEEVYTLLGSVEGVFVGLLHVVNDLPAGLVVDVHLRRERDRR